LNINGYFNFIIIILLLTSCQPKNPIIQEWQYKEIKIPDETHYKILGRDTVCEYFSNKQYKIFTYIDSVGCIGCQFDLYNWKRLIESCGDFRVNFVFVIFSSDYEFLERALNAFHFNIPVIYDYNDEFNKTNHFPPAPYRTFLLDKENKVQLIGSPINNPNMWELYKKTLTQQ